MNPGYELEYPRRRRARWYTLLITVVALLIGARVAVSLVIDYAWWRELGQLDTWTKMLGYSILPGVGLTVVTFALLWIAHARGMKRAGTGLREHPVYARLSSLALLLLALLLTAVLLDSWQAVLFFGSLQLPPEAAGWRDPVFGKPLSFYLFQLPFWKDAARAAIVLGVLAAVLHWLTATFWRITSRFPSWGDQAFEFDLQAELRLGEAFASRLVKGLVAMVLLAMAVNAFLNRYMLLFEEHRTLVGVGWVDEHVRLPLAWLSIAGAILAALLVLSGRYRLAAVLALIIPINAIAPRLVSAVYVRPNELALEKPYIRRHIEATRAAYGFTGRLREVEYPARLESKIDAAEQAVLLENVRLWDWRAFHDTVTQLQALRPYYVFADTDVDRYTIDGKLRQILLTPRELDVRQLPDARANWINSHFIYTHGYGLVMAEANRITPTGAPVFLIADAPPQVRGGGLKLTRPELYYGEVMHEPVFVRTAQPEFNYPAGDENVHSRYEGQGGIPVGNFLMRLAVAFWRGDWNVLLTGYMTPETRMLIRRTIRERARELADFLEWDSDPYLVLTPEGRLVWLLDGYTTSSAHPYSRIIRTQSYGSFNYMRNAVKATIDAYDGTVRMYVFDPEDPIIRVWQKLFPQLLRPASEMPASLRTHVRYPEGLFRVQAEILRTFHMQNPESFYNREDLWDIARSGGTQDRQPESMAPTYLIAQLPGEATPEYLLILPFTPRNKDNMIGLLAARCDGEHLGQLVLLELSKQALIYGPLQITARIDSDQNISKDLTLWNQQGSQVLRGQILVLPVEETFLYIQPIYIQSPQARMPQLKKVAVAMGNQLAYRDTYEQALADLLSGTAATTPVSSQGPAPAPSSSPASGSAATSAAGAPSAPASRDQRLEAIRQHLQRYKELTAQGRLADAGRELEAIEALLR